MLRQRLQFFAVDAPVQQFAIQGLLAEDVDHLQAGRIAVLQIGQRLAKHHALAAAVTINQGELAVRFGFQGAGDDRQHRGDAGTGGNRQVAAFPFGQRLIAKMPLRHHHFQRHPLLDLIPGIAREAPAVDGFYRHADFARLNAAADGVAAAQLFAR